MKWLAGTGKLATALGLCLALAWPPAVTAEQKSRIAQIGFLLPGSQEAYSYYLSEFMAGLRALGYQQQRNFIFRPRWANGRLDRLPSLATELVQSNVDVLVVSSSGAAIAARGATDTIPIVQASGGDPVVNHLAASYSRPEGNVTGISNLAEELSEKTLEKLVQLAPRIGRVGVLINPENASHQPRLMEIREAAVVLRVHAVALTTRKTNLDQIFDTIASEDIGGLIVLSDAMFLTERHKIIEYAAKARVPTIYQIREFVFDGGLMSYGINIGASYRRAATLVDRILKGAKPADLPVERPSKFEFIINLKTARALGRTVPRVLLAGADSVVD